MPEMVEVRREGEILEGWEQVNVSRAIDELAGTFELLFAEVSPEDPIARKLLRGEVVEILIDGELVLSGVVSRRTKAYNGTTNAIAVTGRDLVADVVDCSAANEPGQWRGARIATIARELLEPFPALRFREDLSIAGLGSATEFALQTGESVFSALDRLARMRGLLLASDLRGGVYFTRAGETRAPVALERGVNLEAGSIEEDETGRFSRYIVHGQGPTPAYWDVGQGPGQNFRVETTDPGVLRNRPLVLHAEDAADAAQLRARVRFEASVRAARAAKVTYTLPDWKLGGHLWRPGEKVAIFDPILEIGTAGGSPRDMLVGSVDWTRSANGGSRTILGIYRLGAFTPEPPDPPDRKKKASEVQEHWLD